MDSNRPFTHGVWFRGRPIGLFLEALRIGQPSLYLRPSGLWFGTALILLGVIVNVVCTWSHIRLVRGLARGESGFAGPSAITFAVILAAIGLAMGSTSFRLASPARRIGPNLLEIL